MAWDNGVYFGEEMIVYVLNIFVIALYFWLSFLAFRRWKRSAALRRYAFIFLFGGLWLLDSMLEIGFSKENPQNLIIQDVLGRINFFLAALVAPSMASFAIHFPKYNPALTRTKEFFLILPAVILAILSLFKVFTDFRIVGDRVFYFTTPYYWIYITILFIYFWVIALGVFVYKYIHTQGITKLHLLYILLGYSVTISVLLADSVANAIGDVNDTIDGWVNVIALTFIACSFFTIFKYRLFGIRFLIKRGVVIALTMFILFFFYTYLILSLQRFVPSLELSRPSTIVLIVLFIIVSYPFLGRIARRFSRTLFAESIVLKKERVQKKIRSFTEKTNFQTLFSELARELQSKLKIRTMQGFVLNQKEGYVPCFPNKANPRVHFNRAHAVIHLLRNRERLVVREEIPFLMQDIEQGEREQLLEAEKLLYSLDAELIVLLGADDTAPALLALGEKKDGSVYTTEEITLIREICVVYSNDFQNFFLYQQALRRVGVEV